MTLELDGMSALAAIGANPKLFADVSYEAAKASRNLVVKQLKARSS